MPVTLLTIAERNASDAAVGLIDEAATAHPEIELAPARTIKGTNYKTRVRTAVPTVAFRNANEGSAIVQSASDLRLVETFIINPQFECDKAVADASEDGAAAYLAEEGEAMVEGSFVTLCKQFYYGPGTGGDAKGFPGFLQTYDSTDMVVDAGGTTGDTASSVWGVKFGLKEVRLVVGQEGSIDLSEVSEVRLTDGSNNPYTGYRQELLAYIGLQVGSLYSVGRIKKLTEDSGKGLTDALIASLLEKFPVGKKPDVLLMTRRSQRQLRSSRTATNPTGAPAPFPDESFGVPIKLTDSIINTEALTL